MAPSDEANSSETPGDRLPVLKTYKLYIGGKFPRTESGRFYAPECDGQALGNLCLASRKDVRNAVTAARAAQSGWADRSAYNRSQILYRVAEMLEGRAEQLAAELQRQGLTQSQSTSEVQQSIDRLVYYAGWCDKYQPIFSSVNPVASSHFNFSMLEPMGVVFLVASESSPLLGPISLLAPIIASGNSCVILASESKPLSLVTFGEVLQTSDVPGGVVNVLTGRKSELSEHFSSHKDINAVAYDGDDSTLINLIQQEATSNLKRVRIYHNDWLDQTSANPYLIQDFCEVKTTWHPIEKISASGSGY